MCHSRNTIKKFSHREEPPARSEWRDVAIHVFKILTVSVYVKKFKIHGLPRLAEHFVLALLAMTYWRKSSTPLKHSHISFF